MPAAKRDRFAAGLARVRRDVRDGAERPVAGMVRADWSRMMIPLGTFRQEDGVPPDKSNGELSSIPVQFKLWNGIVHQAVSPGLFQGLIWADEMSN